MYLYRLAVFTAFILLTNAVRLEKRVNKVDAKPNDEVILTGNH